MRKSGQFSIKSFPLKKCFDSDTILVIFMPEKVNSYALMAFDYLGFIASCMDSLSLAILTIFFFKSTIQPQPFFLPSLSSTKSAIPGTLADLQCFLPFCCTSFGQFRCLGIHGFQQICIAMGLCICKSNCWQKYLPASFLLC